MKLFGYELKLFKENPKREMTKELGATGTTFFGGQLTSEEYITELTGSTALTTYDKMRRSDGVVKAALMACELPIRAANWYIQPASDEESDKEVADFIAHNLFNGMSITWDDFLRQALLCLPFGFFVFEKVFQPIDYYGKQMIGWRKFSPRMPKTIYSWKTEAGEDGITQSLPTGEKISIPISKLLIFTYQKEGDNWEGMSVLRSAYRSWYWKTHIEVINTIAFERQGAGLPCGKLPINATAKDRDKMEELLKNIRANEQGYMIQPTDWEVEFKDMKMGTSREPDETIRRYNREILISVLAQFLDLGSGPTGSRALSADHSTTFHNNLIAIAKTVQDVINKYAIKQLVDLNFTVKEYPTLEYSYIGMPKYQTLSTSLAALIEKGAIVPDERLEEHLRQIMDLPEKPEEEEPEEEQPEKEPKTDEIEEEKEEFREFKMSEFVPFRNLTFAEKKVNFKDIQKKTDEESNKLRKELSEIMKKITNDLIRQFEMVLEASSNVEKRKRTERIKVKYQDEYRKALYHSVLDMFQYGKMMAAHEMKKPVPLTPAKSLSLISSLADSLTEMMEDDLLKTGKLALLTELQKKQFTFSEALNRVMSDINDSADSIVLNASSINIGNSMNQGRRASFTAYKNDVYALQRSELLDSVTCNYCMSIDGRTFRKSDSFTKVDLIHSHCRGLWVEILKTEEEKPAIEGMPKTLREAFEGINSFKPPVHPIVRKDSLASDFLKKQEKIEKIMKEKKIRDEYMIERSFGTKNINKITPEMEKKFLDNYFDTTKKIWENKEQVFFQEGKDWFRNQDESGKIEIKSFLYADGKHRAAQIMNFQTYYSRAVGDRSIVFTPFKDFVQKEVSVYRGIIGEYNIEEAKKRVFESFTTDEKLARKFVKDAQAMGQKATIVEAKIRPLDIIGFTSELGEQEVFVDVNYITKFIFK